MPDTPGSVRLGSEAFALVLAAQHLPGPSLPHLAWSCILPRAHLQAEQVLQLQPGSEPWGVQSHRNPDPGEEVLPRAFPSGTHLPARSR